MTDQCSFCTKKVNKKHTPVLLPVLSRLVLYRRCSIHRNLSTDAVRRREPRRVEIERRAAELREKRRREEEHRGRGLPLEEGPRGPWKRKRFYNTSFQGHIYY